MRFIVIYLNIRRNTSCDFKNKNFDNDLTVMLIPETGDLLRFYTKVDAKFDLGYKFINQDKLNEKYSGVSVDTISTKKRVTIIATQK